MKRALAIHLARAYGVFVMNELAPITRRQFVIAGKATFTLASKKSGKHLTFKVSAGKNRETGKTDFDGPRFVSVMTGSDNESSFTFIGTIFRDGAFRPGQRSSIPASDSRVAGFSWLWKNIDALPTEQADFLPACNCCRCGRKLTNPTSVELAIGPECREMLS